MSSRRAFIDLCVKGKIPLDDIDDFVDQWHETPAGMELHDYLGMTQEEYSLWLRVPDALPYIIKSRREGKSLEFVIINGMKISGRLPQSPSVKYLQKWLEEKGKSI